MDSLTVDILPTCPTSFVPECTELCHYRLALTQMLVPEIRNYPGYLLYDLNQFFSNKINDPRWLRITDGVKFIDEVAA